MAHPSTFSPLALFRPALTRHAIQLITVADIEYCRRGVAELKPKTVDDCVANLGVVCQLDRLRVAAPLEK